MKIERKISEIGNSLAVYLPSDLTKYLDLKKGDPITIEDDEDKIIIKKKKE